MNRTTAWVGLVVLGALAGCPAKSASTVTVTTAAHSSAPTTTKSASPATNGNPATNPASPAPGATATPVPLGPAPAGGLLSDVNAAAGAEVRAEATVTFETTRGNVQMTLFPDRAASSVSKFKAAIASGAYDGTAFHRVVGGFVAQGGDPNTRVPAPNPLLVGAFDTFATDDWNNGLKHLPGSLAMARTDQPNTQYGQFYICLAAQSFLDGKYTVFGQVTAGFNTVLTLTKTQDSLNDAVKANVTYDRLLKATVTP